jgi:alpha-galactosidase
MSIHRNQNLFTLHTKNTSYQMKVDSKGVLLHTYYGKRMDDTDCSYTIAKFDRGFSGNIAGTEQERVYSLDYLPQEFPVCGSGDYRVNCLEADFGHGVSDCILFFDHYDIKKGKYSLEGLPAMFAGEEEAQTLEIVLKDAVEEVYVHLFYGVLEEKDVITRAAMIENKSTHEVDIKRIMSACIDFQCAALELVHFYGKHTGERQTEHVTLPHGITEIKSNRGASSHQHNPFVILAEKETTETNGGCYGFALEYSGGFQAQVEVDQFNQVRLVMGIDDSDFLWKLEPGKTFITPEAAMAYSKEGFTRLSHIYHKVFHENLIRSVWKNKRRPILVNNWEATYFDFNEEKLLAIAKEAAKFDLDMLVLDDGWFGKRESDTSGLGDWYVNEKKLGGTLKDLVEKVHDMGLSFGLWFEPEMISEDSDLYREHPDWAFRLPGREPVRSRSQLVLDLSREDVFEYLYERLSFIIETAHIEYIKWDMNRSISGAYSAKLPKDRQGEVKHRFVLNLYRLLERLVKNYPDLLLEGCCGGGGRYDAGMLYYCPQIWCSDNTDAIERLRIQYGTSFAYPMSSISAHVSVCPNHQNGRVTPFKTRAVCAMQGTFGYELDLSILSEEEKEMAKKQIAYFKEHYRLFQFGDYYRLVSPFADKNYTVWEFADKDGKEAYAAVVYTDLYSNPNTEIVCMKGLKEEINYKVWKDEEYIGTISGAALMNVGILLPTPVENYDSYQFYFEAE